LLCVTAVFGGTATRAVAQDRMPAIPAEKLTDAQKKAIEEFKQARSADISGPFVPMLRSPEVMNRARAMGDYLRYKSVLPPRLSEFVILMTARHWTQNYEWSAHEPLARKAGLSPDIIAAIVEGRRPGADAGGRGRALHLLRRAASQPEHQRRDLRAGAGPLRRAGRHRHARHHRVLHDARDGAEHGENPGARWRDARA